MSISARDRVLLSYEDAYSRHSRDVFRFLLALTNEWGAAQDLTQDAFLRLWQHRSSIDWDRPILGWLLVTARRLAQNRFRALTRRVLPTPTGRMTDESARVRWMDVRASFANLTQIERASLILTTVHGWSYDEAAEVMESSAGALRAAVSRARRKLEAPDA